MLVRDQKVVCIHEGTWQYNTNEGFMDFTGETPVLDKVYTIDCQDHWGGYLLREIKPELRKATDGKLYPMGFHESVLRPVVSRSTETGMAILREICATGKLPRRKKKVLENV